MLCPAGHFCNSISMLPIPCPSGTYCFAGSASAAPCPAGSYCPVSSQLPISCPAGMYCEGLASAPTGFTAPGFWSAGGAVSSTALPCGSNEVFCPLGAVAPVPVPSGSYSVGGSDSTRTALAVCPIAHFCMNGVRTPCASGFNATEPGASVCVSTGNFTCPVPTPCSTGQVYNVSLRRCVSCPRGSFAVGAANSDVPQLCQPCSRGFFTDASGATECRQCSAGTFSTATGASACIACSVGRFQASAASSDCTLCPPGRSVGVTGATECAACTVGRFAAGAGNSSCAACPPGRYQPSVSARVCDLCPAGRISASSGAFTCDECVPGRFAASAGSVICDGCRLDTYQPGVGQSVCLLCESASFAPEAATHCTTACVVGTYTIVQADGNTTCLACPQGRWAAGLGLTNANCSGPAAAGYWTNGRAENPQQNPCGSAGLFCPEGSGSVTLVSEGWYSIGSDAPHNRTGQAECEAGSFCMAGIKSPCPAGTYQHQRGQVSCIPCAAGKFGVSEGQTLAACSGNCYPGFVCPERTVAPYSFPCGAPSLFCPAESATPQTVADGWMSVTEADWLASPTFLAIRSQIKGLDAQLSSIRSTQQKCPAGSACSSGLQSLCAAGSFAATEGQTRCTLCQPGKYADEQGSTFCLPCGAGSVAPSAGVKQCLACRPGTAAVDGECVPCPPGRFTSQPAQVNCTACARGSAASESGASSCRQCSAGRFALEESDDCSPCPVGRFQSAVSQSSCLPCTKRIRSDGLAIFTYAPNQGLSACSDCSSGVVFDGTSCEVNTCQAGQFFNETHCSLCEIGKFSPPSALTCLTCPTQTYSAVAGAVRCESCSASPGIVCTDGKAFRRPGYWISLQMLDELGAPATQPFTPLATDSGNGVQHNHLRISSRPSLQFSTAAPLNSSGVARAVVLSYPCPPDACISSSDEVSAPQCAPGRRQDSTNALCASCLDGYSQWGSNCVPCSTVNGGLVVFAITLCWLYVFVMHKLAQHETDRTEIVVYFLQIALFTVGSSAGFVNVLAFIQFEPASSSASLFDTCIAPLSPEQRLAMTFLMPFAFVAMLTVNMGTHWTLTKLWSLADRLRACPRQRAQTAGPDARARAVQERAIDGRAIDPPLSTNALPSILHFSFDAYVHSYLFVFLFSYTQVLSNTVGFLHCIDVNGESLMYTNASINCASAGYLRYRPAVVLLLVLDVVLAPLLLAYFIWHYKPLWILVSRKHAAKLTPEQADAAALKESVAHPELLPAGVTMAEGIAFRRRWGLLFFHFKPSAAFWSTTILLRRALLVGLDAALFLRPADKFLAWSIVHLGVLLLHASTHPYVESISNVMETCCHSLLLLLCIVFASQQAPYSLAVRQTVAVIILLPVGLYVLFHLYTSWKAARRARRRVMQQIKQAMQRDRAALEGEHAEPGFDDEGNEFEQEEQKGAVSDLAPARSPRRATKSGSAASSLRAAAAVAPAAAPSTTPALQVNIHGGSDDEGEAEQLPISMVASSAATRFDATVVVARLSPGNSAKWDKSSGGSGAVHDGADDPVETIHLHSQVPSERGGGGADGARLSHLPLPSPHSNVQALASPSGVLLHSPLVMRGDHLGLLLREPARGEAAVSPTGSAIQGVPPAAARWSKLPARLPGRRGASVAADDPSNFMDLISPAARPRLLPLSEPLGKRSSAGGLKLQPLARAPPSVTAPDAHTHARRTGANEDLAH